MNTLRQLFNFRAEYAPLTITLYLLFLILLLSLLYTIGRNHGRVQRLTEEVIQYTEIDH